MDGEAGWWTTSGKIGLPPLAMVMGVDRQQQQLCYTFKLFILGVTLIEIIETFVAILFYEQINDSVDGYVISLSLIYIYL